MGRLLKSGKTWGRWRYDSVSETLDIKPFEDRGYEYYIDLDHCRTQEEMEHWITNMQEKGWMTSDDLQELILAFEDLCGFVFQESCGF